MKRILFFGLLLLAACSQAPSSVATPDLVAQRLGTRADDAVTGVAADTKLGAVYAIGSTEGSLDGANKGHTDVVLRRYTRSGGVVWKRQLGSSGYDSAGAVAVDGKGFVYAAYTVLSNDTSLGKLEKFRSDGTLSWSRTLKPKNAYDEVYVTALSADANGNVYVAGADGAIGENMFVSKYTGAGSLLWTRRVEGYGLFFFPTGVGNDRSGNVYVVANIVDDGFIDNTILKYSASGQQLFSKTIDVGAKDLELTGLQVQGNALYLAGKVHYNWAGDYGQKIDSDAFVAKYTLSGSVQWRKGFGTPVYDGANSVSVDPSGGVYVTGYTYGTLGGVHPGASDIFLRKFNDKGNALWTKQIGSKGDDFGNAVVAYSSSELYLAGNAGGALQGGTYRGGQDGFLRRTDGNGNRVWTDQ